MALLEKAITTQEELDALIGERLTRDRESRAKKYEGWMSPQDVEKAVSEHRSKAEALSKQLEESAKKSEEAAKQIAQLQAANHRYETDSVKRKVAQEIGLDLSFVDRLNGETEDDIRKDAENLKGIIGNTQKVPPLLNYDSMQGTSSSTAAWNQVLAGLRKG